MFYFDKSVFSSSELFNNLLLEILIFSFLFLLLFLTINLKKNERELIELFYIGIFK